MPPTPLRPQIVDKQKHPSFIRVTSDLCSYLRYSSLRGSLECRKPMAISDPYCYMYSLDILLEEQLSSANSQG